MPLQKLLCQHKNQFYWLQIIFLSGTKCLWLTQYVNEYLVWHKKFGPAQNIFGPVKGQDIIILHMKGLGMRNFQFEIRISQNFRIKSQWQCQVTMTFYASDFRSYCPNIYWTLTILSLPPHKAITSLFDKLLWLLIKMFLVFLSKHLVAHRKKLVLNFHILVR